MDGLTFVIYILASHALTFVDGNTARQTKNAALHAHYWVPRYIIFMAM